jgi:hypothetical protein
LSELAGKSPRLIFSTHRRTAKNVKIAKKGDFELDLEPLEGEVFAVE